MSSEAGEVYRSSWTGTIRENSLIKEDFDWDVDIEHI